MAYSILRMTACAVVAWLICAASVSAQECAATPAEAWRLAQVAVASGDAGAVMLRLSPEYRTRNSVESAVGASMVAELSGLAGELSSTPGASAKAKAAEKRLLAELDALLKKYKAPTIAEIGTPRMMRVSEPEVLARFAPIDHVRFAREIEVFFAKVETASKEAGVTGESPTLDELVVGGGDLSAALTEIAGDGDSAKASASAQTILFKKLGGCWLVDGRQP